MLLNFKHKKSVKLTYKKLLCENSTLEEFRNNMFRKTKGLPSIQNCVWRVITNKAATNTNLKNR